MPLPLSVFCFSKIHIGFTFLVPAHPGSPGKRAVKRVCVCVWQMTCGDGSTGSSVVCRPTPCCIVLFASCPRRRWAPQLDDSMKEPLGQSLQTASTIALLLWRRLELCSSVYSTQLDSDLPSLSVPSLLPSVPLRSSHSCKPAPSPLPLEVAPIAAKGSGGVHKLLQRVRVQPGRQTYFGAF